MKIRTGFVANSSSASYAIHLSAYKSVARLAIEMIKCRDFGKEDAKLIKTIRSSEIDPNTPISFETMSEQTYIAIEDGRYIVETCSNHFFDLEGQMSIDGIDTKIQGRHWFWFPEYNVIGQPLGVDDKICVKHSCDVITLQETNEIVCPKCFYESHKMSINLKGNEKLALLKKSIKMLETDTLISLIENKGSTELWEELRKKVNDL